MSKSDGEVHVNTNRFYVTYKLDENNNPVPTTADDPEWIAQFDGGSMDRRQVDRTEFKDGLLSTVFLGLNHAFGNPPILFETAFFREEGHTIILVRYNTWEQAKEGHESIVDGIDTHRLNGGNWPG